MANSYQVLGASVPAMLGRARLLAQLERHLLKPSPDHVQVVGPKMYGKSVLLNHFAAKHQTGSSYYLTAAYADLRHAPPSTDSQFRGRFARLVKEALTAAKSTVADYLDLGDPNPHELLALVFEELDQQQVRLLVVLDGFDHVLAGTGLSRNLWDQMRSLAQFSSLRIVTGSRRPLRELCKTEESRTSDFWEIFFDSPVYVHGFTEDDWVELIAPLVNAGTVVEASGRKELRNWCGGVPVLAIAMLQGLASELNGSVLSKAEVDRQALNMIADRDQLLNALWDDCTTELRATLAHLSENETDGVPVSGLSSLTCNILKARGFAQVSGNKVKSLCRLLIKFASQQGQPIAEMTRLFGTSDGFEKNVRSLVELRLGHSNSIENADLQLRQYVENAVRDLEPNPESALKWIRSISARALALIWQAELGAAKDLVPREWLDEWQHAGVAHQLDGGRLPRGNGPQCSVLRLATGTDRVRRLARHVSRTSYLLLSHLQQVGDFGQHREDFPESRVTRGFASSVALTAIELLNTLTEDLATSRPGPA